MAGDQTLPDSPPWLFSNPGNVLCACDGLVAYSGASKVHILDVGTGKSVHVLGSDSSKAKVVWVAMQGSALAYSLSDGTVHTLGIHAQDIYSQGKLTIRNDTIESMVYVAEEQLVIGGKTGKLYLCRKNSIERHVSCCSEPVSRLKSLSGMCIFGGKSLYLLDNFSGNGSPFYAHKKPITALSLVTNSLGDLRTALIDASASLIVLHGSELLHTAKLPETGGTGPRLFAVAWVSADLVACGLPAGQLYLYHVGATLTAQLFVNNLHSKAILGLVAFENRIISFGMDRRMTLWEVIESDSASRLATAAQRHYAQPKWSFVALGASVQGLEVTEQGKVLQATGETHLVAWSPAFDLQITVPIDSFSEEEGLKVIRLSPFSPSLLAVFTDQNSVFVYNLDTDASQKRVKVADVQDIAWKSTEEVYVLSPRSLFLWNIRTSQLISLYALNEDCSAFAAVSERMWFGSVRGNILAFASPGKRAFANTTHTGRITALKANNTTVAAASEDSSISLHCANSGKLLGLLVKHCRPVLCLAWHPTDLSLLASGSMDHSVEVWNAATGTAIVSLRGHLGAVRHLVWKQPLVLYSGSDDQTTRVWDLKAPRPDIEPPVLQVSRKAEPSRVKSLFTKLHPLVYQQNRSEALSACKGLLAESNIPSSEHFLFNLDHSKALSLISEAKRSQDSIILTFWEHLDLPVIPNSASPDFPALDSSWIELAPLLGLETWRRLCLSRAEEEMLERNVHKAALCYIAGGQLSTAVQLYTSSGLFIDAAVLAAILQLDVKLIYRQWAERLSSTGLHEQAFKCYLGSNDYLQAYEAIGRSASKDTPLLTELQETVARLI